MTVESQILDLASLGQALREEYGPGKQMPREIRPPGEPKFILQRRFLGEQDLLIIFNTPPCAFRCDFCSLPADSLPQSRVLFTPDDIRIQFTKTAIDLRHTLHTLDRLTISNDGSVLDEKTFPRDALLDIVRFTNVYKNIKTFVLETRLEFIDLDFLGKIQQEVLRTRVNILTGFETLDEEIRTKVLGKEPLKRFLAGLDQVAKSGCDFTAYVLYKPHYKMTDNEAYLEARRSILFLEEECRKRNLPLTVRLNPMYRAEGTPWAERVREHGWRPPKLSDVLELAADMRKRRIKVYIGLSSENLANGTGTYSAREDYSRRLIKEAILFNTDPSYIPTYPQMVTAQSS